MANENRFYLTASELSDLMGISIGHAYKLIRDMNAELAKEGYIVVAGKVPKRYVEKRCYIRMYDELKRGEGDNPTIGIVLCSDTDEDIAKYSVLHGNEQLFASKYKLYLPTEEELRAEIETQKEMFYLQNKS